MDKLKVIYNDFYNISKIYLEKETNINTLDPDFDTDVSTLMCLIPLLEKKVCIISSSISDDDIISMMRYCNYKIFSFWFLKSGAVVKSVYNKLDEKDKDIFKNIFKNMLINTQILISLNNMYNSIRKDTANIIEDSKKIIEIINQIKKSSGESSAYQILQNNYSFIIKTINKVLSDEHYILKMIAVFDSKLVNDKDKLSEYRELFTISTESIIHGIKCVTDLDISTVVVDNNKYISFFKKVLSNVIIFQNNEINSQRFVYTIAKLYVLIYHQLTLNPKVIELLSDILESVKYKISIDEIKQKGITNLQTLIKFISDNKNLYKSIIVNEYINRENIIIELLQSIANDYNILSDGKIININYLIKIFKDRFNKF
nr:virion morphogenesis core protein [Wadden Sea poxvirus]